MAILGKIRERSIFLIIVIGLALFAFVISGVFDGSSSNSGPDDPIGIINDEELDLELFRQLVEQTERSSNYSSMQSLNLVWNQLLRNTIFNQEYKKLGIDAGKDQIEQIISTNPFSWTSDSQWHSDLKNQSIINKAQDYDFTDRLRPEHTGAKKSIGLTRIQGFTAALNNETGMLETKGPLIDNIKKMKYFISIFLVFFILSPFSYAYISITQKDKRTDYPGKKIAEIVEKKWNENFVNDIAEARTYALFEDIEKMRTAGLAMGGNLNNAVVVDKFKILNPNGLRFDNEFVKHKTLDCIGDFYLLGMPLVGAVECYAPGHSLNQNLVKEKLKDEKNFKIDTIIPNDISDKYYNIINNNVNSQQEINVA